MSGKLPTTCARTGLQVDDLDPRLLPGLLRHVGDVLRRRRIARRHDELVALRQEAHVGAVLVHDREALAAVLLRPGFVDEDDARVEEAADAGDLGVDRVRDDVADPAPEVRIGEVLLPGDLLAGIDVPEPELGLEPARGVAGDAARSRAPGRRPRARPRSAARCRRPAARESAPCRRARNSPSAAGCS